MVTIVKEVYANLWRANPHNVPNPIITKQMALVTPLFKIQPLDDPTPRENIDK